MNKQFFWKIWLKPNRLTKDETNDFFAEVSTTGKTLRNEDIARIIKDEGSELQYETLLDVLTHCDRLRRTHLQQGYCVQTGVCHIVPRVSGNWIGATKHFNPDEHKITCTFTASSELRHALEEVGVEVLGIRDDDNSAFIGMVTDVQTGKTDGTITSDGDIIIDGEKIKITPLDDPTLGVFFVDENLKEKGLDHRLSENNPKRIVCRVPADLHCGTYTLKIVTRYSNGSTLLNNSRTIQYNQVLTIGEIVEETV